MTDPPSQFMRIVLLNQGAPLLNKWPHIKALKEMNNEKQHQFTLVILPKMKHRQLNHVSSRKARLFSPQGPHPQNFRLWWIEVYVETVLKPWSLSLFSFTSSIHPTIDIMFPFISSFNGTICKIFHFLLNVPGDGYLGLFVFFLITIMAYAT